MEERAARVNTKVALLINAWIGPSWLINLEDNSSTFLVDSCPSTPQLMAGFSPQAIIIIITHTSFMNINTQVMF